MVLVRATGPVPDFISCGRVCAFPDNIPRRARQEPRVDKEARLRVLDEQKAKEKAEPIDSVPGNEDHTDSEGSEDEDEAAAAGTSSGVQVATPSTASKKKKKTKVAILG